MNFHSGVVIRGKGRAGALGYPTVNIPLEDHGISGIYSALVKIGDGVNPAEPDARPEGFREYIAAVFVDPKRKLLEAHLLDYSGELYGIEVAIELCEKIRGSEKFDDDEDLRLAIKKDISKVRDYFAKQS